jgi:hypothetical protein
MGTIPGFQGMSSRNPFRPQNLESQGDGQNPAGFFGNVVPQEGRYPAFLKDVISKAYQM